jgi:hypothetical protein
VADLLAGRIDALTTRLDREDLFDDGTVGTQAGEKDKAD